MSRILSCLCAAGVLTGCSEYALHAGFEANPPPLEVDEEDEGVPPSDPPGDEEEVITCEDLAPIHFDWYASDPFAEMADPQDEHGLPFHAPEFDAGGFSGVELPDDATPAGFDRVYLGEFELTALPPSLWATVQSDDGLWLWLNGTFLGHWGGGWQEEGCVNDEANCGEYVLVEPLDLAPLLQPGGNVVAARVSNPFMNTWFDVSTECID